MRTAKVFTNLTCNQACTYCDARRASEDPRFVHPLAVRRRIADALAAGATALEFTGGEPTLRRDLAALLAHARALGAGPLALETNATLVDDARARELRDAGLASARVNLAGDAGIDAVTRDPGGFLRTIQGVRALVAAGVAVEIAATIVRSTLALAPGLPAALVAHLGADHGVRAIVVAVPVRAPDPAEPVAYEDAVAAVLALDAAARAVGIPVRMRTEATPPPCVFPPRSRSLHLYALPPGGAARAGYTHPAACSTCQVVDRCPGLSREYLAARPPPRMHPLTDARARRRLAVVSTVDDQVTREFVSPNRTEKVPGQPGLDEIIRVNFHCNQACRFCFVSTHLPAAGDARVREAIASAGRRGARVILSGGEPTLNPHLPEYIRLARAHGGQPVFLETNATRLADAALARAVADAGLGTAFVSLHAPTAAVSDAITEAPGTFAKTVAGVDNLAALGVAVVLNFVVCQANYRLLSDWVRFVHGRWPAALLNVSFIAASADVVPRERDLVPRFADVKPHLAAALALAADLAMRVSGFESMCGLPLCQVPTSVEHAFAMSDLPPDLGRGEFVRGEACGRCALATKCYGLRGGYAAIYGTDELTAVPARGP